MAARKRETVTVVSQEQLADGIFSMWIQTEAAKTARPGQFISMYTNDEANCFQDRSVSARLIRKHRNFGLYTV